MTQPDLVERLRDSIHQCRALDRSQLLAEAAHEVARLRGEVVLWKAAATLTHAERETLRYACNALAGCEEGRRLAWLFERLTSEV